VKQASTHPTALRGHVIALSVGLACVGLVADASAQKVGTGAGGRAVHVIRDTAAARTVATVYEGTFSYVRIETAEPGAAPSLHPVTVSTAALRQALGAVQFNDEALFNDDELAEIVPPLVVALGKATAGQDVSFAVPGRHTRPAFIAPHSVTTGRLFRTAEGLQLIVGLAQMPFESEFNATGVLIAFEPGRRSGPVDATVKLSMGDAASPLRRADWVTLALDAGAPAAAAANAPAPAAAPVSPAAAATAPVPAPAAVAPRPSADADALYRNISERLKTLQRLRDSGLITPQEYEEKRRQVLGEL